LTVNFGISSSSSSDAGTFTVTVPVVGEFTFSLEDEEDEPCEKMEDTRKTLCPIGGLVPSSAGTKVTAA